MFQSERFESAQGAIDAALDGRQSQIWTAMPGIVLSRNGNNVSVQVAVKARVVSKTGQFSDVALPPLINVPLVMPSGGGFGVTLPIGVGDEVLVHFASRCIDAWWAGGGVQPQIEMRMHDLSDGFAQPASMSNPKAMANISNDTMQIRSHDGTTVIEMAAGGNINITTPGTLKIMGDVEIHGDVSLVAGGSLTAAGAVEAGVGGGDHVTLQHHVHTANNTPATPGT